MPRIPNLPMAAVLLLSLPPMAWAAGVEGRWNLTEQAGSRSFASWLELRREGGEWTGKYLHRGGHPLPAKVVVEGDQVTVTVVPEPGAPVRPDARYPTLTGRLQGDVLQGTGLDGRGAPFDWKGVRAPDRLEGSNRQVTWGEPMQLFNGKDLTGWVPVEANRENRWKAVDGVLVNEGSGANLRTVEEFRDFKLSLEWKIPPGSNSGIYLRGRYETQVADDYGKAPYPRCVGGIYGQLTPLVNAVKPAGEWNSVEITLVGYRVSITVNGQKTLDGELLPGITGGALDSNEPAPGPLMLQGDHGTVSYRNIVLTPAR